MRPTRTDEVVCVRKYKGIVAFTTMVLMPWLSKLRPVLAVLPNGQFDVINAQN